MAKIIDGGVTMETKDYVVKLMIEAQSRAEIDEMIEGMPHVDRIWDEEIVDPDEDILEARIRYVEDWEGQGEHFLFENKRTHEEEWGLDTAFPLINNKLHYTALTKVRELMRLGIPFHFE